MNQLVNDLMAARKLLESPDRWTKGIYARNERGDAVFLDSPVACSFCLVGAVRRVSNRSDILEQCLWALPQDFDMLSKFNDAESTTHADVLALLDRAIAEASK